MGYGPWASKIILFSTIFQTSDPEPWKKGWKIGVEEDAVVAKLVENIRQYKPSVVVSHDINGEIWAWCA